MRQLIVMAALVMTSVAFGTGKWGFIDTTGTTVIAPQYEAVRGFSDGMAAVRLNDKWGYVNHAGQLAIPARYVAVYDFHDGRAWADTAGGSVCFDVSGRPAFQLDCDANWSFSESLSAVRTGWHWGFVDCQGKLVVDTLFDNAYRFSEGLAPVALEDGTTGDMLWGYVARDGKLAIQPAYDNADGFACNRALVSIADAGFYIDRRGRRMTDSLSGMTGFSENRATYPTREMASMATLTRLARPRLLLGSTSPAISPRAWPRSRLRTNGATLT